MTDYMLRRPRCPSTPSSVRPCLSNKQGHRFHPSALSQSAAIRSFRTPRHCLNYPFPDTTRQRLHRHTSGGVLAPLCGHYLVASPSDAERFVSACVQEKDFGGHTSYSRVNTSVRMQIQMIAATVQKTPQPHSGAAKRSRMRYPTAVGVIGKKLGNRFG